MSCTFEKIKTCGNYCVVKIIPPIEEQSEPPIGITKVGQDNHIPIDTKPVVEAKKQKHVTFNSKLQYIVPLVSNKKDIIHIDEFTSFNESPKKKERVSKILEEGFDKS